jgi:hypothetical protein
MAARGLVSHGYRRCHDPAWRPSGGSGVNAIEFDVSYTDFGATCIGELIRTRLAVKRLFPERVDVGGDVLRLPPRQRQVHPRVRIEQREGEHVGIEAEFPGDRLEWRRVGHFPRLVRSNRMTGHAACLRQPSAVIRVSGECRRCEQERRKQHTKAKRPQSILPAQMGIRQRTAVTIDSVPRYAPTEIARWN